MFLFANCVLSVVRRKRILYCRTWQMIASSSPNPVHANSPLIRDSLTCAVRRTRNSYGDRCFPAAGPRVWNFLPAELRHYDSLKGIQPAFKDSFFRYGIIALCDICSFSAIKKYSCSLTHVSSPDFWSFSKPPNY